MPYELISPLIKSGERKGFMFVFFFLLLFIVLPQSVDAIGTEVGTIIKGGRAVISHDNRVSYSNEQVVEVHQNHGLKHYCSNMFRPSRKNRSYFFHHVITNVGNGSDLYLIKLVGTSPGWKASLIKDTNFNGKHESFEPPINQDKIRLAEDASLSLFVVLTAPPGAKLGKSFLKMFGQVNDGGSYVGENGFYYAGPDSVVSENTVEIK